MSYILGIDPSTTCTGLCVLSDGGADLSAIKFTAKRFVTMYDKAVVLRENLEHLAATYPINKVVIEQSVMRMRKGQSSAHTIQVLSRWNGFVSYIAFHVFGFEPYHLDCRVARKRVGVFVPKGSNAKDCVLSWLANKRNFIPEYTKNGTVKQEFYDMADAYILALAVKHSPPQL